MAWTNLSIVTRVPVYSQQENIVNRELVVIDNENNLNPRCSDAWSTRTARWVYPEIRRSRCHLIELLPSCTD